MTIKLGDVSITKGVTEKIPLAEWTVFLGQFAEEDFGEFNVIKQDDADADGYTGRYKSKDGITVIIDHDVKEQMTIVALPDELD